MKIIIVGTAYPYRGGLAAFNERLAHEYLKQGHEVEMYTFTLQYPSFLFPGKTQFSLEAPPTGLCIRRTINSINPFTWAKTGKEIRKKQPDIVVFAYWMAFMAPCYSAIARYAAAPQTKMIGLIHNMIPHEPTVLDRLFPGHFVKRMDGFVAMADAVVKDIETFDKRGKLKIVSPHPLYDHYGDILPRAEALQHLNLPVADKYILFFGFIRQYKGLDLLISAMSDRRIRELDIRLIVAGEFYGDPAPYLQQIKELGLSDRIILRTEFIADSEVKYYFSAADLVVQPYRSATQSGVSQIAYHFEKPMLVTNVGGLSEIVPDGKVGYVVVPEPGEIASAISDFYENQRSGQFAPHIKTEKNKYLWSGMVDAINKAASINETV